jgi:sulfate adenylyltransferase subunit 1
MSMNNSINVSGLLRFITAGSVDDGKSTLIGRMLYDSKNLQVDQLTAVEASSKKRGMKEVDLSLITDGLLAEREQGITIDVAYRYFATPARKFIVGDSPGHLQYTRNMVTAASSADLAIVLIDAESGVKPQTRRHLYLVHWVGVSHVLFAVNKMDKVGFSEDVYQKIERECVELAQSIGYSKIHSMPVSALDGDNITSRGDRLSWYEGPTLLEYLEQAPTVQDFSHLPFRFSVQRVMRLNRQNIQVNSGFDGADFRGYQGLVVSGEVSVGDEVVISPGGHRAKIKSILGASRRFIDSALPQESVTLFLDQDYDVSRGTLFTDVNNPMLSSNEFNAELCWFDEAPLDLSRTYLMKQMSKATRVRLEAINELVNVETLERTANHLSMCMNDIGQVSLKTQTALSFDSFKSNQGTGAFILIDEVSNRTVAAGTIQ